MVPTGRLVIGILLLIAAGFMWIYIDNAPPWVESGVQFCNAGWGDLFGAIMQKACIQIQLLYYSPWILGIVGIIFLIESLSDWKGMIIVIGVLIILFLIIYFVPLGSYLQEKNPTPQQTNSGLQVIKTLQINEDDGIQSDGLIQPNLAETTTITSNADGTIKFQYIVPQTHCGDAKVHVLLNGQHVSTTKWMGNYQNNPSLPLKSGIIEFKDNVKPNTDYSISFYPESRKGGCIVDYIPSWFGTVEFYR